MTYRMPAEWAPHEKVWIGFPSHENAWGTPLADAQRQMAAFANAVYDNGAGEEVYLIAGSTEAAFFAREMALPGVHVEQYTIGDVWLRDTACIIVKNGDRRLARNFGFNGWGDRYHYEGDQSIGTDLASAHGFDISVCDWILEGGSIDVDGEGLAVTTQDCLLNPNRNTGLDKGEIERKLQRDLGVDRLLWLGDGLANDHTDGHVDNLARFVGSGHLVIPEASGNDDPNASVYEDARKAAEEFGCQVTRIPSVGRFEQDGEIVPASYINFYIGNTVVIVPQYGSEHDNDALSIFGKLFPARRVIGLPADAILTGGGSFHCSSQQIPI